MARYGQGYENMDDAAAAALWFLERQPRVADQEYMGVLVQDPATKLYYRSDFQTQGNPMTSAWSGVPEGTITGSVHTHPRPQKGDRTPRTHFSDTDVATAKKYKSPSYMVAVNPDQKVPKSMVYRPGQTPTYNAGDNYSIARTQSEGEELLAQIPIEEQLQYQSRTNPLTRAYLAARGRLPEGNLFVSRGNLPPGTPTTTLPPPQKFNGSTR